MDEGLLSLRKCAAALGVSHPYLSKFKKEGAFSEHPIPGRVRGGYRLSEVREALPEREKVEEEIPTPDLFDDGMLPESSVADMSDADRAKYYEALRELERVKASVVDDDEDEEDDDELGKVTYRAAKTRREHWLAVIAEIKARAERAEVVRRSDVDAAVADVAMRQKDTMQSGRPKLAISLVGKTAAEIELALEERDQGLLSMWAEFQV